MPTPWRALPSVLALAGLTVLLAAEQRRPLRVREPDRPRRRARNLAFAALSALTVRTLEAPVVEPLARRVAARRWGLVQRLPLPPPLRAALAVVLLDGTLYAWHVLTHRVPWLWRLHAVHHADAALDATTALRFHALELAASVPWRAAQVLVIGVSPGWLVAWQRLTLASILFHHADLALPARWEGRLAWLVTTPRLHGLHHDVHADALASNLSSGLSAWDRLFGTFRADVPQAAVTIGLPGLREPGALTLGRMLALPLRRRPPIAPVGEDGVADGTAGS